jgi:hypothetical protein
MPMEEEDILICYLYGDAKYIVTLEVNHLKIIN